MALNVLLAKPEFLQTEPLSRALGAFKKVALHDASRLARNCWGIAGKNLDEASAASLMEALKKEGLGGVRVSSLNSLPPVQILMKAEPMEEGLQAHFKNGAIKMVSWENLSILAAAGFEETSSKTIEVKEGPTKVERALSAGILLTTGIPVRIGQKSQTVRKTEEKSNSIFLADIFMEDAQERWRIDAQDISYEYLKERRLYSSFANFKILLQDLAKSAPKAWRNKGTRTILENGPIHMMGYQNLADLEKESTWLLTLKSLPPLVS